MIKLKICREYENVDGDTYPGIDAEFTLGYADGEETWMQLVDNFLQSIIVLGYIIDIEKVMRAVEDTHNPTKGTDQ